MSSIIIAGTFQIDPDKLTLAIEAMQVMQAETRAEDGCLAYTFSRDMTEPTTIHLFEEWTTAEALAAHSASTHMAAFRASLGADTVVERALHRWSASDKAPL